MCLSINFNNCYNKNGEFSDKLLNIELKRTIKLLKETRKKRNSSIILIEIIKGSDVDNYHIGDIFIARNMNDMDRYVTLIERIKDGYKTSADVLKENVKILENPYPCKYKITSTLSFLDDMPDFP